MATTTSISGVGTVSSAGVGSGLDVNAIVNQLLAVESRPLSLLQSRATDLKTELSTFGTIKGKYADLGTAVDALLAPGLWNGTTATSDDAASVAVSSAGGAAAGNYTVVVSNLASAQAVTSSAFGSSGSTLSAGTLTFELGAWSGSGTPPSTFTAKSGAPPVTLTIGASDSLATIRDKINAAGAGVTASLINDGSGSRLSLRSSATGAVNGFRVTATESQDDGNAATGLSALGFDPSAGASTLTLSQSARDANATINGVAVTSASNTLKDVVDGLTLKLQKQPAAAVNVTVAADTASVKTAITGFVTAFNALASYIHTQTAYDATNKTGGPLQGDQSALSMQNQLRTVLNQSSSASATWSRLSDIGITIQSDGTLASNSTKLGNALTNLPELKKLFFTDGATPAASGFARRFRRIADAALSFGGVFDSRTASLNASLDLNSKQQDEMQTRLNATEARLRAQYTALDKTMGQLNGLSSYITQQITLMNKSGN